MGEHDHGHTRGACTGHRASKRGADEEGARWKEWELHHQCDVEEHLGTISLPVCGHMVPSSIWKGIFWNWKLSKLWPNPQHHHLQHICLLPGKSSSTSTHAQQTLPKISLYVFTWLLNGCAAVQRGELARDGEDKRAPRDTEQPRVRLRCWLDSPLPDHNCWVLWDICKHHSSHNEAMESKYIHWLLRHAHCCHLENTNSH